MGNTSLFLALSPTKGQLLIIEGWSDFCPPGFVNTWRAFDCQDLGGMTGLRGQRSRMLLNILQGAEKLPSRGNDPDQNVDNGEAENDPPEMYGKKTWYSL